MKVQYNVKTHYRTRIGADSFGELGVASEEPEHTALAAPGSNVKGHVYFSCPIHGPTEQPHRPSFWQVGSAATINGAGGGTMVGTIIASTGVTFSTAGVVTITTLEGRAIGLNASVTMVNTHINVPAP